MSERTFTIFVPNSNNITTVMDQTRALPQKWNLWAFVFTPLWLLYHRAWGVFGLFVLSLALIAGFEILTSRTEITALMQALISVLIAAEAPDIVAHVWRKRGFLEQTTLAAQSKSHAIERYFESALSPTLTSSPTSGGAAPHATAPTAHRQSPPSDQHPIH